MNLDDYVDVPTRLKLALERWPDLRVQELGYRLEQFADTPTIVCEVRIYRTPDDPYPAIATASEPLPGKTPYTRDSELMNGFTSALGRALGYMGIGLTSSIASRNDVQARPYDDRPTTMTPRSSAEPPSDKQLRMLKALGSTARPATKREASELIDKLKNGMATGLTMAQEDPF